MPSIPLINDFFMIKILALLLSLAFVLALINPYRRCSDNPLYTSGAVASYMFAMPLSFIEITDSLIYYNVKHYGFKLNNPGLGACSNYFLSQSSCCNDTTIAALLNHTLTVYQSYANVTKLPIVSLANDLSGLLAGSNSSCLNSNGSLNNLKLPGVNGVNSSAVSDSIATAYSQQNIQLAILVATEQALIQNQSCLLCLATQDWDKFILSNASVVYDSGYYNNLINVYTSSLTILSNSSATITNYVTDFLTKNVNSSKCSSLYSNYTARINSSTLCTSNATCNAFATTYFGHLLLPGVVWKMYRTYINRSDAVAYYEGPAFGDGFKGNVSYV